jgi:hypothetical protein
MDVAHGRRNAVVPQQPLQGGQIGPCFQQVGGKAVAQGMDAARLGDPGAALGSIV